MIGTPVESPSRSYKPVVLTTQGVTWFEDEPGETYTSTTTVQFLWLVERLRGCIPSTMFEICTGFSSIRPSNIGGRCEVVTQPSVVDVCHARSCMNRGRSSPIVDIGSCTNVVPDLRRSDSWGGELRIIHLRHQVIGCLRYTKSCWVGKHINMIINPTNFPTQGQPNPRKTRLKVVFGPRFPTGDAFLWIGIGFHRGNRLQET